MAQNQFSNKQAPLTFKIWLWFKVMTHRERDYFVKFQEIPPQKRRSWYIFQTYTLCALIFTMWPRVKVRTNHWGMEIICVKFHEICSKQQWVIANTSLLNIQPLWLWPSRCGLRSIYTIKLAKNFFKNFIFWLINLITVIFWSLLLI